MAYANPWSLMGPNATDVDTMKRLGLLPDEDTPGAQYDLTAQGDADREPAGDTAFDNSPKKGVVGPPLPPQIAQAAQKLTLTPADITPAISGVQPMTADRLQPVEAHSGLQEQEKQDQSAKRQVNQQSLLTMTPEQWEQAYENVAKTPMFQQQAQGLDRLDDLYAQQMARPAQVDLSPLLALADSQTGSRLLAGYKRPMTTDERAQEAAASAQKLQQDRAALSKEILDTAVKEKGGYLSDLQQLMLGSQLMEGANDPFLKAHFNPATAIHDFTSMTQAESKSIRDNDETLQKVLVAVNSGNPAEQKGVPVMIARMLEGARPAMAAAALETGDPSLIQRLSQMGSRLGSGQLTSENVGQYTKFIHDMQQVNEIYKRAAVKRWKTAGVAMNIDPTTVDGMIPPEWLSPFAGQTAGIMKKAPKPQHVGSGNAASGAGAGPGGAMSFEQWKAAQGK